MISESSSAILVHVNSTRQRSKCPLCHQSSRHIHSRYFRTPADLPCVGRPIKLILSVRKFFCRVAICPRKVFVERLPELIEPASRLTIRLRATLRQLGFSCGGKGSERLAARLGMNVSDTTVLWSVSQERVSTAGAICAVGTHDAEQVRVVGIDDWSWRRGQRFGTIIVDLERRRLVDLLPERSVESIRAWLAAHPQIEVVSRDRGGHYVDGATQGAPQATQVADRWHLYKNLGEAVEAFLVRSKVRVPDVPEVCDTSDAQQTPDASVLALPSMSLLPPPISARPHHQQQAYTRLVLKWELHQRVHHLHTEGMSLHGIAREMGLARNTVRKYARRPVPNSVTEPTPRPRRRSVLDPYEEHLLRRWNEGCLNGALLEEEIREQGYAGGRTVVKDYIRYLRKHSELATSPRPRRERAASASPRELRWLLARQPGDLDEEQQARLHRLLATSTDVQQIHALLHNFHIMVRQKEHERLDWWLEQAQRSGIPEMKSFALGIRRDYGAVKAAIVLPWSQGQTEGHVNKLKTMKRAMYGRAGFELLRQRLLQANGAPSG